jgi:hypothetical protein
MSGEGCNVCRLLGNARSRVFVFSPLRLNDFVPIHAGEFFTPFRASTATETMVFILSGYRAAAITVHLDVWEQRSADEASRV